MAALTIVAFALRAPNLGRAYWIDEGISIGISSHHLSQIPSLLRQDGSPPLFYFILHFWMMAFGTSEVATHLLPMLCSLIAIPVAYWSGTSLFDRRAGIAAAALLATNPFLEWYSTETRMYPLVVVLTIVGITLAWKAMGSRSKMTAAGAVVTFAALLYTHDWGIYLAGVTAAVLLGVAVSRKDTRLATGVVAASAATVILWLPWLPSFISQAQNTAAPWAVRPQIGDFFADPSTALGGTLGVITVPALAFGAWWTRRHRPRELGSVAGLIGAIGLLTTLAGFLGAQLEPSWTVRYLAVIVGPFLMASAGAMAYSRRGQVIIAGVCVVLAVWTVIGFILPNSNARWAKSNVEAVAAAVRPKLGPGDVVVVTQTEQTAVVFHYLPKDLVYATPTGRTTDPGVVDWKNLVQRLQQATPCGALGPVINAAPVGALILEINPARTLGASGTAWSKAVNAQVLDDTTFLAKDHGLVAVGLYNPASKPAPYSPVDGVLFRKVSAAAACS